MTLFLLEGGSEASVVVEVEGPRLIDNRVLFGKDEDQRLGEVREERANDVFYGGRKMERSAFFKEERDRADATGYVGRNLR